MDNNLLYKIALSKVPRIGSIMAKNLIRHYGSAENVFKAKNKDLVRIPGIGRKLVINLKQTKKLLQEAEIELKRLAHHQINILDFENPEYPERLRHIPSAPYLLYQRGHQNLNPRRTVAIVGTRKPTPLGETMCNRLVSELGAYDTTIISGLAYGIDIIAHKACVHAKIPTIGIMGNGFGKIYPSAHIHVARKMMQKGCLLTEFEYNKGPDRENFPARNRIIAGMADAIIVVESAEKGGSMITAVFGNEYNKDVFAIPGRPGDSSSAGCNFLIKMHQAHLCESGLDIAVHMGWDDQKKTSRQKDLFEQLDEKEKQLVNLISSNDSAGIDYLAYESSMPQSQLISLLLNLEFKGCIKALPGKRFTTL